jgi:adenylate cyclase
MRDAGAQLSALMAQAFDPSPRGAGETAQLRQEFRTPLNAIKGYGELLVEEIHESGPDTPLNDVGKVLDLVDRLLGEIDSIVETAGAPSIDIIGDVLQTMQPLEEADIRDPRAASSQILIVDDNAANRDLLSRRLVREGYRVTAPRPT